LFTWCARSTASSQTLLRTTARIMARTHATGRCGRAPKPVELALEAEVEVALLMLGSSRR
jgi:hypothetical protein